jgi:uncharacterized peroxidase-related enzyme
MARISRLDKDQVDPETKSIYDVYLKERGNVPNMFRTAAHRPEIFRTMIAHFRAVMNTGTVPAKLKELVIVRTSQINRCEYWLSSHTALARRHGWTDAQIDNLADFGQRSDFNDAEKAALDLAERVTRDPHEVDDAFWAELRRHYDEGEIIELLAAIGLFNYFNRFNDALRMEPTK